MFSNDSFTCKIPKSPNPSFFTKVNVFWGQKKYGSLLSNNCREETEIDLNLYLPSKITTEESSPPKVVYSSSRREFQKGGNICIPMTNSY